MLTVNAIQLQQIIAKLRTLGKTGKVAVRTSAKKAMLPVRQQVKDAAPVDTTAPDNIRIKASVRLRSRWNGDSLRVRVGIEGGAKANKETPFYFRFHEFGTQHLPARPFMTPALESNAHQILDTVAEQLTKELFG